MTKTTMHYAVFHTDGIATMDRLTTHRTLTEARRACADRRANAYVHGSSRRAAARAYIVRSVPADDRLNNEI